MAGSKITNYRRITSAMPKELARILSEFDKEYVTDNWFCKNCPIREDGCPVQEAGACPFTDDVEIILRWLNAEAEE